MKRGTIVGIAMSALIVGVVVATLLPATGQVTGSTFTLCEKDSQDYGKDVDNPPKDFSAGDFFVFSEPEFDTDGNRVGRSVGSATVIKAFKRDGLVQFNVSLQLTGGDIEVQSAARFGQLDSGHRLAIIGGTGRYHDATGVVKLYSRPCPGVGQKGDHLKVVLN
jgi:hypothetical protein